MYSYHVRLGAIKIQIQPQYSQYFPNNMESVRLLEMPIAIIHTRIAMPNSVHEFVF